ncbi:MAG TPA: hypothetical protein VM425_00685 [Myxococcota bacterium]|nr:hypothetical protein [Myxococcota bacterium]
MHDLNDFLRLSEVLNLQLSIEPLGRVNVASVILHRKQLPHNEREVLASVIRYIDEAYGQRRRRIGPLAVLHPLRATALLARAQGQVNLLDLQTCLLHDKLEDLTPEDLGRERWESLEVGFQRLLKSIDPLDEWFLMERLDRLTKRVGETYFQYIGRLLDKAIQTPELVRVKLADRLDNTLDMHVEIEDPIQGVDFFGTIFQIMMVNSFHGYRPELSHQPPSPLNGAQRLYQLFKSAVLMSLVRQYKVATDDRTTQELFEALALASMKEAHRIVLHIFGYHQTDMARQRALLMEVLDYAQAGFTDKVTRPHKKHRLDGLFFSRFKDSDSNVRRRSLAELYKDKDMMIEAAMALGIIFQGFLNDPDYFVQGISVQGIRPTD